jgi:hypothetical protein
MSQAADYIEQTDRKIAEQAARVTKLERQNTALETDKRELLKFVRLIFDYLKESESETAEDARALLVKNGISTKPEGSDTTQSAQLRDAGFGSGGII